MRARNFAERGGAAQRVSLVEAALCADERSPDLVALDEALGALAAVDRRKSLVVELRFFGGMSVEETAEVLNILADTVMRDWRLAKSWLLRQICGEARHGS